jgi:multiple sugar transport system ATP-binding protein
MGNHQVVWMKSAGQGFSARARGRRVSAGDPLAFDIDESLLSVFDAASEQRLS